VQASVSATNERVSAAASDLRSGKYLVFDLDGEECCIQVLKVREIIGVQDITAVPQTPVFVKGVINLRGKVIPVVDLRLKFGLPQQEYNQRTCIIVVQVERESRAMMMGIVVDSVAEVLMAKIKGRVKLLLDIDEVMSSQELQGLDLLKKQEPQA
jgi:purine-binding chemotaxis protein CheW